MTSAGIADTTGGSFRISGFVVVDATLTGASANVTSTPTIDNAKCGAIDLACGEYNVVFNAAGGSPVAADNTASIATGNGSDTFALNCSSGEIAANVIAASGTDKMTLIDTGRVTVIAGSDITDVTGGSGADTYTFGANAGILMVSDFQSAQDDMPQIAASLQSEMRTSVSGGSTILGYGYGQQIILASATGNVANAIAST